MSTTYTVKHGDSLARIAKAQGVTLGELLKANPQLFANGRHPHLIHAGDTVTIPERSAFSRHNNLKTGTMECPGGTQNPGITTVCGPKDLGCGGFDWKVWFDLPEAAGKDGWVIQEITASYDTAKPDGTTDFKKTYHYWEAWEVKAGKRVTVWQDQALDDNDDQYFSPSRPGTKGTTKVVGKAKFAEGPLSADFKTNNPDTTAGILHSTTTQPGCWDGTGTRHDISSTWDCTGAVKSSTVTGKAGDLDVKSTT